MASWPSWCLSSRTKIVTVLSICMPCPHLRQCHRRWESKDLLPSRTCTSPDRTLHIQECFPIKDLPTRACTQAECHLATRDNGVDQSPLPSTSRCCMVVRCQPLTSNSRLLRNSTHSSLHSFTSQCHSTQGSLWAPVCRLTRLLAMAWICVRCPCRRRRRLRSLLAPDFSQAILNRLRIHSLPQTSTVSLLVRSCRRLLWWTLQT